MSEPIEQRLRELSCRVSSSDVPMEVVDILDESAEFIQRMKTAARTVIQRHESGVLARQGDSMSIEALKEFTR